MKTIFSSFSRLFFAYSKFIVMVTMLSGLSTAAQSSEATYLTCNDRYYRLTGTYMESNYNIRTKKFLHKSKIISYGVNVIHFSYGNQISRNTGEWKNSNGEQICILKKINTFNLPKIDQEGKLF